MKIEKRGYSHNPWRLVTSDGREVTLLKTVDHPHLGQTVISGSVCGQTRRECEANALALLEQLLERLDMPR
jgi:hypothetical protein